MDNTPPQATDAAQVRAATTPPVSTRPATYSLILALVLRMSPVGPDLLFSAVYLRSPWLYIALAGLLYLLILLPIAGMARHYGRTALKAAPKRIIATLLIVVVSIAVDVAVVYRMVTAEQGG